jgi:uncharacterized membrane protein YuzA (DUF378 family)|tara:strand:- start:13812 stop:14054 length:243 start_codon:yes stop_codon:yes gene_type:complete
MGIFHPSIPEVSWLDNVSLIITVVAGINWGLFAFADINLVTHFVDNLYLHRFIYGIIVLASLKLLFVWKKCLACSKISVD